jgi:hypothetical protein
MCQPHESLSPYIQLINGLEACGYGSDEWLDDDINDPEAKRLANERCHIDHQPLLHLLLLYDVTTSLDVCQLIVSYMEPPVYDMAHILHRLWTDPGIQRVYQARSLYQLTVGCEYMFNKILIMGARNPTTTQVTRRTEAAGGDEKKKSKKRDEIKHHDYIPTIDDITHARVRTTGIVENAYTFTPLPPRESSLPPSPFASIVSLKCPGEPTAAADNGLPCQVLTDDDKRQRQHQHDLLTQHYLQSKIHRDLKDGTADVGMDNKHGVGMVPTENGNGGAAILLRPTFPPGTTISSRPQEDPRPLAFKIFDVGGQRGERKKWIWYVWSPRPLVILSSTCLIPYVYVGLML